MIVDFHIWTVIQIAPGKLILRLIKIRPFKFIKNKFITSKKLFIKKIILVLINRKTLEKKIFSSCLSRSITAQFFFDYADIPNIINFGITKTEFGDLNAHCWLTDPHTGNNFSMPFKNSFK